VRSDGEVRARSPRGPFAVRPARGTLINRFSLGWPGRLVHRRPGWAGSAPLGVAGGGRTRRGRLRGGLRREASRVAYAEGALRWVDPRTSLWRPEGYGPFGADSRGGALLGGAKAQPLPAGRGGLGREADSERWRFAGWSQGAVVDGRREADSSGGGGGLERWRSRTRAVAVADSGGGGLGSGGFAGRLRLGGLDPPGSVF
jgi:hypothetical protein